VSSDLPVITRQSCCREVPAYRARYCFEIPRPIRRTSSCFPRGVSSGNPGDSSSDGTALVDICIGQKYTSIPNIPRNNATFVTDSRTTCDQSQQVGAQGEERQEATSAESGASRRERSEDQDQNTWTRSSEAGQGKSASSSVSREGAQRPAEMRTGHIGPATLSCRRDGRRCGKGALGLPRSETRLVLRAWRGVPCGRTGKTHWRG
jgi:hypothetical protein